MEQGFYALCAPLPQFPQLGSLRFSLVLFWGSGLGCVLGLVSGSVLVRAAWLVLRVLLRVDVLLRWGPFRALAEFRQ